MIDPVRVGPAHLAAASGAKNVPAARVDTAVTSPRPRSDAPATGATVPRLLDLVADLANAGPPVDDAKIAQVRRAIADGSYKIDADALAKAILGFARKA